MCGKRDEEKSNKSKRMKSFMNAAEGKNAANGKKINRNETSEGIPRGGERDRTSEWRDRDSMNLI